MTELVDAVFAAGVDPAYGLVAHEVAGAGNDALNGEFGADIMLVEPAMDDSAEELVDAAPAAQLVTALARQGL